MRRKHTSETLYEAILGALAVGFALGLVVADLLITYL